MIRFIGGLFLLLACSFAHASFPAASDPTVCTVAPCYNYQGVGSPANGVISTSKETACQSWMAVKTSHPSSGSNYAFTSVGGGLGKSCYAWITRKSDGYNYGFTSPQPAGDLTITSAAPSPPAYSCPPNSSLSGTTCTCASTHNQVGSTCVAKAVCDWALGKTILASGELALPVLNATSCFAGCRFHGDTVPKFLYTPEGTTTVFAKYEVGSMVGTGSECNGSEGMDTGGGPGTVDAPPEPPDIPDSGCPPGEVAGAQIIVPGGGGGYVCGPPSTSENKEKQVKEETLDGVPTTTTTETTTTCGVNSCNTTVSTSVTTPSGTTTKSETTTQDKDGFCSSSPNVKNCSGSGDGKGVGSGGDQSTPDHPKLWEKKYPDGLSGVWAAKKTALLNTDIGKLAPSLMPNNIPQSASLPVWNLPLDFGPGMNYGSSNVAPTAEIWGWAKVFLIISALLLARALIFGG